MRLNVIGNGFDMYHGLPCSYYYFGCYLVSNYYDFYKEMSNMFGFSCEKFYEYHDTETCVDDMFWRSFEEKLGELNPLWMEDSLLDDLGLECDDAIDLETPEVANSEEIKRKFCSWIYKTVNTKQNYKIINELIANNKCDFRDNDFFINFNYTQTLEEIYNIPYYKVFHIHGNCRIGDEECSLIIGHGNDENIVRLREDIEEIKNSYFYLYNQASRNRLNEYECECSILEDLRKDVPHLISSLGSELDRRELMIDEIWIWGLSCGDVDKPYIEYLKNRYPNAKWKFSYFNEDEKEVRISYARELGLDEMKVDYFEFVNRNSNIILRNIIEENDIEEYPCE